MSQIRPEVDETLEYLRHIFKALRNSSSQLEKDLGLSAAQIFVLKSLKDKPDLSINELAQKTVTHQSSVSVVVKKLEDQGLVFRSNSVTDSRKVIVSLTENGKVKAGELPRGITDVMIETLQSMHPEKTVTLAKLMGEFVRKAKVMDFTAD